MLKYTNNAKGTLGANLGSGDTTIALTSGHGARFPATSAEDYFIATLIDASNNVEIIKVHVRTADTLDPVVRGYDGSTPRSFQSGDKIELRWCRAMQDINQDEGNLFPATSGTDTYTANLRQIPKAYNTNQLYAAKIGNANTSTAPTINFDSLGAKTIKLLSGAALAAGDLAAGAIALFVYNGTDMLLINPSLPAGAAGTVLMASSSDPQALSRVASLNNRKDGLALSNSAGDPTNDIDIATGAAMDSGNAFWMVLGSALTKRIDASWAVGSGNGGLDGSESVAGTPDNDTWYYLYLIRRSDTGVVDGLFSESPTAPTMPTNYDQKRLLGAVRRDTALNRLFYQIDDAFFYQTLDSVLSAGTATSNTSVTISGAVPPIAKSFFASARADMGTADSTQISNSTVVQVATSVDYATMAFIGGQCENVGFTFQALGGMMEIPNTGVFSYRNVQSGTPSRDSNIWVHGFRLEGR